MNYPLLSEYIEAIKAAEDNFDKLKHLRPVLDDDDQPFMSSGYFAVVFKMRDEQTGKLLAVKCFLKEQEGRAEAYRLIAEELEFISSTFLTPISYLSKELFVDTKASDETAFPVLLMDWVEGVTLDKYIHEHIYDEYELSLLAYQFSRMAMWLMPQPFAHGDLKPDNILVRENGSLVLVDYDGMYVPAMEGQKARELGSPDFRHPSRTETDFDEHIDDFSLASILLSLKAISLKSGLLDEYGAQGRLLFSENDYRYLSESKVMDALKPLMQDAELASLYSLFILAISQNNLSQVSFRLFNLSRPEILQYEEENLSTEVTAEDFDNNGRWDEYGAKYSDDGFRLIFPPSNMEEYSIKQGTKVICNFAFEGSDIHSIIIPNSVVKIGRDSFAGCRNISFVNIPSSVIEIGEFAFVESVIKAVRMNEGIKKIGDDAFRLSGLISITIPHSVKEIGSCAFYECEKLVSVTFLNSSVRLGADIFVGCNSLKSICVPYGTINIFKKLLPEWQDIIEEDYFEKASLDNESDVLNTEISKDDLAMAWIGDFGVKYSADRKRLLRAKSEIVDFYVRKGTKVICDRAFCGSVVDGGGYYSLSSIVIPEGVMALGKESFFSSKLLSIYLPKTIKKIGENAFGYCQNLISIVVDSQNTQYDSRDNCNAVIEKETNTLIAGCKYSLIPHGVRKIGNYAFSGCSGLTSIIIPDSVVEIGEYAFYGCYDLTSIIIPDSVTRICDKAFGSCKSLHAIIIPDSVKWIGNAAFAGCSSLSKVIVSNNVYYLGNGTFKYCTNLKTISLPENLHTIGEMTFEGCLSLQTITIPNGVSYIDNSFWGCKNLSCISIPNSVTYIGNNTFMECHSLKEIRIPIGRMYKFEKLLSYYKDILVEQYEDENLSTEVTEDDLVNAWTDEYGVMYSVDKKRLLKAPKNLVEYSIPEGTKVICNGFTSVYNCGIRKTSAFNGCTVLTRVEIPNTVSRIGYKSFNNCRNLNTVVLPDSILSFEEQVFAGCFQLHRIVIPFGTKEKFHFWLSQLSDKFVEQIKR